METVGTREWAQPAPPHVIFDDLAHPDRQPGRPWLYLRADEIAPVVVEAERPSRLVWSSIWARRPDARIAFELPGKRGGTVLRWTILVNDPAPDTALADHMWNRINTLVNGHLRHNYGQIEPLAEDSASRSENTRRRLRAVS